jgi:hypothetical protein
MKKIEKEYAMNTLKTWADLNFVMIKNRTWTSGAYFPDDKNSVGSLVHAINGNYDFYFDDNEFVQDDKTIFVVKHEKSTTKDLFNKLIELGII